MIHPHSPLALIGAILLSVLLNAPRPSCAQSTVDDIAAITLDAFRDFMTANYRSGVYIESVERVNHGTSNEPRIRVDTLAGNLLPIYELSETRIVSLPKYATLRFCLQGESVCSIMPWTGAISTTEYQPPPRYVDYLPLSTFTYDLETQQPEDVIYFPYDDVTLRCIPYDDYWCTDSYSVEYTILSKLLVIFRFVEYKAVHTRTLWIPRRRINPPVTISFRKEPLARLVELESVAKVTDQFAGRFLSEYIISADRAELRVHNQFVAHFPGECTGLINRDNRRVAPASNRSYNLTEILRGYTPAERASTYSSCSFRSKPNEMYRYVAMLKAVDIMDPVVSEDTFVFDRLRIAAGVPNIARVQIVINEGVDFAHKSERGFASPNAVQVVFFFFIYVYPENDPRHYSYVLETLMTQQQNSTGAEYEGGGDWVWTSPPTTHIAYPNLTGTEEYKWYGDSWLEHSEMVRGPERGVASLDNPFQYAAYNPYEFSFSRYQYAEDEEPLLCDLNPYDAYHVRKERLYLPTGEMSDSFSVSHDYNILVCKEDSQRIPRARDVIVHKVLPEAMQNISLHVFDANDLLFGSLDKSSSKYAFYSRERLGGLAEGAGFKFNQTRFPWGELRGPACPGLPLEPDVVYAFTRFCVSTSNYTVANAAEVVQTLSEPFAYQAVDTSGFETPAAFVHLRVVSTPTVCRASETTGPLSDQCTALGLEKPHGSDILVTIPIGALIVTVDNSTGAVETHVVYAHGDAVELTNKESVADNGTATGFNELAEREPEALPNIWLSVTRLPRNGTLYHCDFEEDGCRSRREPVRLGDAVRVWIGDNPLFLYDSEPLYHNFDYFVLNALSARSVSRNHSNSQQKQNTLVPIYRQITGELFDGSCGETLSLQHGCPDHFEFKVDTREIAPITSRYNLYVQNNEGYDQQEPDELAPPFLDGDDALGIVVSSTLEVNDFCGAGPRHVRLSIAGDLEIPSPYTRVGLVVFTRLPLHGDLYACKDVPTCHELGPRIRIGADGFVHADPSHYVFAYVPHADYANRVASLQSHADPPVFEDELGRRAGACLYHAPPHQTNLSLLNSTTGNVVYPPAEQIVCSDLFDYEVVFEHVQYTPVTNNVLEVLNSIAATSLTKIFLGYVNRVTESARRYEATVLEKVRRRVRRYVQVQQQPSIPLMFKLSIPSSPEHSSVPSAESIVIYDPDADYYDLEMLLVLDARLASFMLPETPSPELAELVRYHKIACGAHRCSFIARPAALNDVLYAITPFIIPLYALETHILLQLRLVRSYRRLFLDPQTLLPGGEQGARFVYVENSECAGLTSALPRQFEYEFFALLPGAPLDTYASYDEPSAPFVNNVTVDNCLPFPRVRRFAVPVFDADDHNHYLLEIYNQSGLVAGAVQNTSHSAFHNTTETLGARTGWDVLPGAGIQWETTRFANGSGEIRAGDCLGPALPAGEVVPTYEFCVVFFEPISENVVAYFRAVDASGLQSERALATFAQNGIRSCSADETSLPGSSECVVVAHSPGPLADPSEDTIVQVHVESIVYPAFEVTPGDYASLVVTELPANGVLYHCVEDDMDEEEVSQEYWLQNRNCTSRGAPVRIGENVTVKAGRNPVFRYVPRSLFVTFFYNSIFPAPDPGENGGGGGESADYAFLFSKPYSAWEPLQTACALAASHGCPDVLRYSLYPIVSDLNIDGLGSTFVPVRVNIHVTGLGSVAPKPCSATETSGMYANDCSSRGRIHSEHMDYVYTIWDLVTANGTYTSPSLAKPYTLPSTSASILVQNEMMHDVANIRVAIHVDPIFDYHGRPLRQWVKLRSLPRGGRLFFCADPGVCNSPGEEITERHVLTDDNNATAVQVSNGLNNVYIYVADPGFGTYEPLEDYPGGAVSTPGVYETPRVSLASELGIHPPDNDTAYLHFRFSTEDGTLLDAHDESCRNHTFLLGCPDHFTFVVGTDTVNSDVSRYNVHVPLPRNTMQRTTNSRPAGFVETEILPAETLYMMANIPGCGSAKNMSLILPLRLPAQFDAHLIMTYTVLTLPANGNLFACASNANCRSPYSPVPTRASFAEYEEYESVGPAEAGWLVTEGQRLVFHAASDEEANAIPVAQRDRFPTLVYAPDDLYVNYGADNLPACSYKDVESGDCAERIEIAVRLKYPTGKTRDVFLRYGVHVYSFTHHLPEIRVAHMPYLETDGFGEPSYAEQEIRSFYFPFGDALRYEFTLTSGVVRFYPTQPRLYDMKVCTQGSGKRCSFVCYPSELNTRLSLLRLETEYRPALSFVHLAVTRIVTAYAAQCRNTSDAMEYMPGYTFLARTLNSTYDGTSTLPSIFRIENLTVYTEHDVAEYPFTLDISHSYDFIPDGTEDIGDVGFYAHDGTLRLGAGVRFSQTELVSGQIRAAGCKGPALNPAQYHRATSFCYVRAMHLSMTETVSFTVRSADAAFSTNISSQVVFEKPLQLKTCVAGEAGAGGALGSDCSSVGMGSDYVRGKSWIPVALNLTDETEVREGAFVNVDLLAMPDYGRLYECLDVGVCEELGRELKTDDTVRVPIGAGAPSMVYIADTEYYNFALERKVVCDEQRQLVQEAEPPVYANGNLVFAGGAPQAAAFYGRVMYREPQTFALSKSTAACRGNSTAVAVGGCPDRILFRPWLYAHSPKRAVAAHNLFVQRPEEIRNRAVFAASDDTPPPPPDLANLCSCHASATAGIDYPVCTARGSENEPIPIRIQLEAASAEYPDGVVAANSSLDSLLNEHIILRSLPKYGTLYRCLDLGTCRQKGEAVRLDAEGGTVAYVQLTWRMFSNTENGDIVFMYVPNTEYFNYDLDTTNPSWNQKSDVAPPVFYNRETGLAFHYCNPDAVNYINATIPFDIEHSKTKGCPDFFTFSLGYLGQGEFEMSTYRVNVYVRNQNSPVIPPSSLVTTAQRGLFEEVSEPVRDALGGVRIYEPLYSLENAYDCDRHFAAIPFGTNMLEAAKNSGLSKVWEAKGLVSPHDYEILYADIINEPKFGRLYDPTAGYLSKGTRISADFNFMTRYRFNCLEWLSGQGSLDMNTAPFDFVQCSYLYGTYLTWRLRDEAFSAELLESIQQDITGYVASMQLQDQEYIEYIPNIGFANSKRDSNNEIGKYDDINPPFLPSCPTRYGCTESVAFGVYFRRFRTGSAHIYYVHVAYDIWVVKRATVPQFALISVPGPGGEYASEDFEYHDADGQGYLSKFRVSTERVRMFLDAETYAQYGRHFLHGCNGYRCTFHCYPDELRDILYAIRFSAQDLQGTERFVRVQLRYIHKMHTDTLEPVPYDEPLRSKSYSGLLGTNPNLLVYPKAKPSDCLYSRGGVTVYLSMPVDSSSATPVPEVIGTTEVLSMRGPLTRRAAPRVSAGSDQEERPVHYDPGDPGDASTLRFTYGATNPPGAVRGKLQFATSYRTNVSVVAYAADEDDGPEEIIEVVEVEKLLDYTFHRRRRFEYKADLPELFSVWDTYDMGYMCTREWYDERQLYSGFTFELHDASEEGGGEEEEEEEVVALWDRPDLVICMAPVFHRVSICLHDTQRYPTVEDIRAYRPAYGAGRVFEIAVYDGNDGTFDAHAGEYSWYAFFAESGEIMPNAGIVFLETELEGGEIRRADCTGGALDPTLVHRATVFCYVRYTDKSTDYDYALYYALDNGGGPSDELGAVSFENPIELETCYADEDSGFDHGECTAIGKETGRGEPTRELIPIQVPIRQRKLSLDVDLSNAHIDEYDSSNVYVEIAELPKHGTLYYCPDWETCKRDLGSRDHLHADLGGDEIITQAVSERKVVAGRMYPAESGDRILFAYVGKGDYFNFAMYQTIRCPTTASVELDTPFPVFVDRKDKPYRQCVYGEFAGCPDAFPFRVHLTGSASVEGRFNVYVQNTVSWAWLAKPNRVQRSTLDGYASEGFFDFNYKFTYPAPRGSKSTLSGLASRLTGSQSTFTETTYHGLASYSPKTADKASAEGAQHLISRPYSEIYSTELSKTVKDTTYRVRGYYKRTLNSPLEPREPFLLYHDPDGDTFDVEVTIVTSGLHYQVITPQRVDSEYDINYNHFPEEFRHADAENVEIIPGTDIECYENGLCSGSMTLRGVPSDIRAQLDRIVYSFHASSVKDENGNVQTTPFHQQMHFQLTKIRRTPQRLKEYCELFGNMRIEWGFSPPDRDVVAFPEAECMKNNNEKNFLFYLPSKDEDRNRAVERDEDYINKNLRPAYRDRFKDIWVCPTTYTTRQALYYPPLAHEGLLDGQDYIDSRLLTVDFFPSYMTEPTMIEVEKEFDWKMFIVQLIIEEIVMMLIMVALAFIFPPIAAGGAAAMATLRGARMARAGTTAVKAQKVSSVTLKVSSGGSKLGTWTRSVRHDVGRSVGTVATSSQKASRITRLGDFFRSIFRGGRLNRIALKLGQKLDTLRITRRAVLQRTPPRVPKPRAVENVAKVTQVTKSASAARTGASVVSKPTRIVTLGPRMTTMVTRVNTGVRTIVGGVRRAAVAVAQFVRRTGTWLAGYVRQGVQNLVKTLKNLKARFNKWRKARRDKRRQRRKERRERREQRKKDREEARRKKKEEREARKKKKEDAKKKKRDRANRVVKQMRDDKGGWSNLRYVSSNLFRAAKFGLRMAFSFAFSFGKYIMEWYIWLMTVFSLITLSNLLLAFQYLIEDYEAAYARARLEEQGRLATTEDNLTRKVAPPANKETIGEQILAYALGMITGAFAVSA